MYASCVSPLSLTALDQGAHTLDVRAIDAAGNLDGSPAHRSWIVDTIAPDTAITSGSTGSVPAGPVEIGFTSEAGASFECRLDTGSFASCASPLRIESPAAGPHTVEVRAVDRAGNHDTSPASHSWTTVAPDTTTPETTILSAPSGRILEGPVAVTFESNEPGRFECDIDGMGFEPCSSPLDLPSPARGAHAVRIRAIDEAGNADPTPEVASWRTIAARIDLCGQISADRTIGPDEGRVYILACDVTVAPNARLTVEPGSLIKALSTRTLRVDGTLVANGTQAEPVTITSERDDTAGGDTNGDGDTTAPAAGNWQGIVVTSGAELDLTRVQLRHTSYAIQASDASKFSIVDSTITDAAETGVYASFFSTTVPRLSGNSISRTGGPAIQLRSEHLDLTKLTGNTGSATHGGLQMAGAIDVNGSLPVGGLTPQIGINNTGEQLRIGDTSTVTLPAGAIWKALSTRTLRVDGTLVANGTQAEPVTITSERDDTAGGDTNGDGDTTAPAAGNWQGIRRHAAAPSSISRGCSCATPATRSRPATRRSSRSSTPRSPTPPRPASTPASSRRRSRD